MTGEGAIPSRPTMKEIWKDIKDYEGYYQVSNLGRVKSLDHYVNTSRGNRIVKSRILKLYDKKGYFEVVLSKENKLKYYLVSRLVYSTFNGPIPSGMQVNHIDEDKHNNRLDNLNLMSPKDNTNWGTHNERLSKSKKKWVIKLSTNNEILHFYESVDKAKEETGIWNIASCCRGERKTAGGYVWKYAE